MEPYFWIKVAPPSTAKPPFRPFTRLFSRASSSSPASVSASASAASSPRRPSKRTRKVVLLHGWLQSHRAWIDLATKLRDNYGYESLLLDFYGHGLSPYPKDFNVLGATLFVKQVRDAIVRVGWQNEKLIFVGMSLGAAVTMRYTSKYPGCARSYLFVAPAGRTEPSMFNIPNISRNIFHLCVRLGRAVEKSSSIGRALTHFPPIFRLLSHMNIVKDAPYYYVDQDSYNIKGVKYLVLVGRFDELHTPQEGKWRSSGSEAKVIVYPWDFHASMCYDPSRFKIENFRNFWLNDSVESNDPPQNDQCSSPAVSTRIAGGLKRPGTAQSAPNVIPVARSML